MGVWNARFVRMCPNFQSSHKNWFLIKKIYCITWHKSWIEIQLRLIFGLPNAIECLDVKLDENRQRQSKKILSFKMYSGWSHTRILWSWDFFIFYFFFSLMRTAGCGSRLVFTIKILLECQKCFVDVLDEICLRQSQTIVNHQNGHWIATFFVCFFFFFFLRAFVGYPTWPSVVDHLCSIPVEN